MDVTQALKDTENSLRDFIGTILSKIKGEKWIESCGVSAQRIEQWKSRQQEDMKKSKLSGIYEERLIYYADFYDILTILSGNWNGPFADAFGKLRNMEVWLEEMGKLRDPDAHRRELLPHQKHLILGLSGEIRTKIIRYRSRMETSEDFYPGIDVVRDSLGNTGHPGSSRGVGGQDHVWAKNKLRIGDKIDFVISAADPLGDEIEYKIIRCQSNFTSDWQKVNVFSWTVTREDIGVNSAIFFKIRSSREFHALNDYDDSVCFHYEVLPISR